MSLSVAIVEMVNATYLRHLDAADAVSEQLNSTETTSDLTVQADDDPCVAEHNATNVSNHQVGSYSLVLSSVLLLNVGSRDCNPGTIFQSRDSGIPGLGTSRPN